MNLLTLGLGRGPVRALEAVHWNDADLAYWAVSDLNLHDLARLADLVRQSRPRAAPGGE